ncbi:MAG TPA: DciA family protein [Myxococcales bacterium]|nr:DciA family protein [Myxococcales bacterium]
MREQTKRRSELLRGILSRELRANGIAARLPKRIPPGLWENAVGKQIAARAQPTVLSSGTLHVLVQDHRWRDQLDAARNFLVERLNRELGAGSVRTLQFGLAHAGALDEGRRRAGIGQVELPAAFVEPSSVLGGARLEPELREAVLRAAEAQARRREGAER